MKKLVQIQNLLQICFDFLDDTISNSVPEDPLPEFTLPIFEEHSCTVCGVNFTDIYYEHLDTL